MLKFALTALILATSLYTPSSMSAAASAPVSTYGMKVPPALSSRVVIPLPVKIVLDRDFRSRYPLAAPVKLDVLKASIEIYDVFQIPNGFGGYDTRHYFRIVTIHDNGAKVLVESSLIERSDFEPNQDPILVENFRVIGWAP